LERHAVTPEVAQRQAAHQEAIAVNFHENIQPLLLNESDAFQLRYYQPPVLQDMDDFVVETRHDLGRAILIPQAGNFGKSFISMLTMELAGVGRPVAETGEKMRGLFFTSRAVGIDQALKTYKKINPDLTVGVFSKDIEPEHFDDFDVFAMTYMGLSILPEDIWSRLIQNRDIFALDEAHRAIGAKTVPRFLKAREIRQPTFLTCTATPYYNENHTVSNRLKVHKQTSTTTPRDAIYLGAANDAQLIALYSGQEVSFRGRADTMMREKDVEPLALSPGRNQLILDVMADMAEADRPGIVQLIPGQNSTHAQKIAKWAQRDNLDEWTEGEPIGRLIVDPRSGELRPMRVKALGDFQLRRINLDNMRLLVEGEIDALTFTKYITESFDAPDGLGYLLQGSPVGSWADINQFAARGSRFFRLPTLYISIIDNYKSNLVRRFYTFFDAFGERRVFQGMLINRPNHAMDDPKPHDSPPVPLVPNKVGSLGPNFNHPSRQGKQPLDKLSLSESVVRSLRKIPPGTILDELILAAPVIDKIPEGYIPMAELPAVRDGLITPEGATYVLADRSTQAGQPLSRLIKLSDRIYRYAHAEEADRALMQRSMTANNVRFMEIGAFLVQISWPHPSFQSLFSLYAETGASYTSIRKGVYSSTENARKALIKLMESPLVNPEEEVTVSSVISALGLTSNTFLTRVIRLNESMYRQYLRPRRFGLVHPYKKVETLTLAGMAKLLNDAAARSRRSRGRGAGVVLGSLATKIDAFGIDNLIRHAQDEVRGYYQERKIDPKALTVEAIERFLAPYRQIARQERRIPKPAEKPSAPHPYYTTAATISARAQQTTTEPPKPLDETFALSGLKNNWLNHGSCIGEHSELFFSIASEGSPASRKQITTAKNICASCPVKGDCLHFAISTQTDAGIFGSMTPVERRQLSDEARRWLKEQY
jgi:WhiB family redox-sensing transcriptional regulator